MKLAQYIAAAVTGIGGAVVAGKLMSNDKKNAEATTPGETTSATTAETTATTTTVETPEKTEE